MDNNVNTATTSARIPDASTVTPQGPTLAPQNTGTTVPQETIPAANVTTQATQATMLAADATTQTSLNATAVQMAGAIAVTPQQGPIIGELKPQTAVVLGELSERWSNMEELTCEVWLQRLPTEKADAIRRLRMQLKQHPLCTKCDINVGDNADKSKITCSLSVTIGDDTFTKNRLKLDELIVGLGCFRQIALSYSVMNELRLRFACLGIELNTAPSEGSVQLTRNGHSVSSEHEMASPKTRTWLRQAVVHHESLFKLEELALQNGLLVDYSDDSFRVVRRDRPDECWPTNGERALLAAPESVVELETWLAHLSDNSESVAS